MVDLDLDDVPSFVEGHWAKTVQRGDGPPRLADSVPPESTVITITRPLPEGTTAFWIISSNQQEFVEVERWVNSLTAWVRRGARLTPVGYHFPGAEVSPP